MIPKKTYTGVWDEESQRSKSPKIIRPFSETYLTSQEHDGAPWFRPRAARYGIYTAPQAASVSWTTVKPAGPLAPPVPTGVCNLAAS